jgi:1,2-diacylglycerol 3-beta-glucosyltransferase
MTVFDPGAGAAALAVQGLAGLLTAIAGMICLYYLALAAWSLCVRTSTREPQAEYGRHTFAIVIPAHNEEGGIAQAVKSCVGLDYPKDKYRIYVVADNCMDRTAQLAEQAGANCLVRTDPANRGKGYALEWAFARIVPLGHDAVLVMDADCTLEADALRVFDRCLGEGAQVLQANDVVSNPNESPMTYVLAVGNVIENELFYAPKSRLGLAVFLRGTGMVFRREVLLEHPWQANSLVEDVEYTLGLLEQGTRVRFVQEVRVASPFPVNHQQLSVQRVRWAKGNIGFGESRALALVGKGLARRSLLLCDAGWTLLVLSRPLVLLELALALVMSGLAVLVAPGSTSRTLLGTVGVLMMLQGAYLTAGIGLLGLDRTRLRLLLKAPMVILYLIVIAIKSLVGRGESTWERTPRSL